MKPLGPAPVLTAPGVVLRPWTEADLPRMVELFDDPEVAAWTPLAAPYTLADARQMYDAGLRRARRAEAQKWAVTVAGGVALGEVMIMLPVAEAPWAELGYVLGVAGRGRGLVSAALPLVIGYGREVLDRHEFRLVIAAGNEPSEAVARRCGFRIGAGPHEWRENKGRSVELRHWELP